MSLAKLVPLGKQTFFDSNGDPLAGGSVYMYTPNTTNYKNTYQDEEMTISNTNPVVLDAAGRAVIYGTGQYRQLVKDSLGNTIWDQLVRVCDCQGILWAGTSTGTANSQVLTLENGSLAVTDGEPDLGQVIAFMFGRSNTAALDVTVEWGAGASNGPKDVLKYTEEGAVEMIGGEAVTGNLGIIVYDDESAAWHIVNYVPVAASFKDMIFSVFQPSDEHRCVATFGQSLRLPEDALGSWAYTWTLPTAETTIQVRKISGDVGTSTLIGNIVFGTSSHMGAFENFTANRDFEPGESLMLVFPNPADATLGSLSVCFKLAKQEV